MKTKTEPLAHEVCGRKGAVASEAAKVHGCLEK